jgi:hypothetical protein
VKIPRVIVGVAFAWLLLLFVSAFYWFPPLPRTTRGWLFFVLLAPPLYVLGEWLGERFDRPWWESSLAGKIVKAILFIAVAAILTVVCQLLAFL